MQKVFLIGGYDLEMEEIVKILSTNNAVYYDKKLSWGAKLSSYSEYFNDEDTFYGIELEPDITTPLHYIKIDHHYEDSDKKSSLEQILEIFNIPFDRNYQLVAANDSHYIPGMEKLNATEEEIKDIREKDRKAQGVTEQDLILAYEAIENKTSIKEITVVYSKTERFSPICDKLYPYKKLLIYTDHSLMHYGENKNKLVEKYKDSLIKEGKCFYGGDLKNGFFGLKEDMLDEKEILNLRDEIIDIVTSPFSYHVFMFPFKWDYCSSGRIKNIYELPIKERLNIKKFNEFLGDEWTYKEFKIDEPSDYNEYVYFYEYVRDAIYNTKNLSDRKLFNDETSYYYENKKITRQNNYKYFIKLKTGKLFELAIEAVSLKLYETGAGILSFHLTNNNYYDKEDILKINDFGRRIYPQFLGYNYSLDKVKESFFSDYIYIDNERKPDDKINKTGFENSNYNKFNSNSQSDINEIKNNSSPIILPDFIHSLFTQEYITTKIRRNSIVISPIIDDRMYVLCWYGNDFITNELKGYDDRKNEYNFLYSDFWYQFVFVDGNGKTCQSKVMSKNLLNDVTNDRWIEYNTLYGISRYSFVCLTNESFIGKSVILTHCKTMYFQMALLCLAQRVSMLRFSNEVTHISSLKETKIIKVTELYKMYLNFVNKIYFREVTAQEQGIELYKMMHKNMNIDNDIKDLNYEIAELHNYISLINDKDTQFTLTKLTKISGFLLIPALIAGFFGMDFIYNRPFCFLKNPFLGFGIFCNCYTHW